MSEKKELSIFKYDRGYETLQVRTVSNGEVLFVAMDVCRVLGYADRDQAIRSHCKHAKLLKAVELTGLDIGPRGALVIPESDLYRLILRSNMPDAEKFQDWVVEEVLPRIRKTGGYVAGEEHCESEEELTLRVMQMLQRKVDAQKLELEKKARIIEDQKPKVIAHDAFIEKGRLYSCTEAAKSLGFRSAFAFNKELRRMGLMFEHKTTPTHKGVATGILVVKMNDGWAQTFVTPRGLAWLAQKRPPVQQSRGKVMHV